MRPTIIVTNRAHLDQLIAQEMKTQGPSCDLNHLDISAVTDLSSLFAKFATFQGDVSLESILPRGPLEVGYFERD